MKFIKGFGSGGQFQVGSGKRATWSVAVVALSAAVVLAGCSASDGGSLSGTGTGDSASTSNASLTQLLEKDYENPYPTTPTALGDHQIAYIAAGVAAGGNAEVQKVRSAIFAKSGWDIDGPLDGKFAPNTQSSLVQQAVLQKKDAIILDTVYPSAIPAGIEAAREARIPILCIACTGDVMPEGVTSVSASADSLVTDLTQVVLAAVDKPNATIVMVTDDEFLSVKATNEAQENLINEQCPDCTVVKVPITSADLGKPAIPSFVNMLRQYPKGKIDAVLTPFAPATSSLITLAEQSGRSDFKIFNLYGDAPIAGWIRDGLHAPLLFGDAIVSQSYMAYAAIDTLSRIFNAEPIMDLSNLPAAPITQENAVEFVDGNGLWEPQDMDSKFMALWGLQS